MDKTKVIFRKYKDNGDILALFPELPFTGHNFTSVSGLIESYEHIGQHGPADYDHCVKNLTTKATPEEYDDLKKELESIGYILNIRQRK